MDGVSMTIIKPGKTQDPVMTGTCSNCECQIECLKHEAHRKDDTVERPGWFAYYVQCPNCNRTLYVEEKA
jgi:hypothetical protein